MNRAPLSTWTRNTGSSRQPAVPHLLAVKRWSWAGWYARWEWRYLVNGRGRPRTQAGISGRYAERLVYARVHDLLRAAEAAYREPRGGGVPVGIFAGRGVLGPSATAPQSPHNSRRPSQ